MPAALMLLSCVSLGLPGAVIYELSRPFIWLVHREAVSSSDLGDSAWPLAIYISIFWPWGIVPGYLIADRWLELDSTALRILLILAVMGVWAVGVAIALYPLARP